MDNGVVQDKKLAKSLEPVRARVGDGVWEAAGGYEGLRNGMPNHAGPSAAKADGDKARLRHAADMTASLQGGVGGLGGLPHMRPAREFGDIMACALREIVTPKKHLPAVYAHASVVQDDMNVTDAERSG